MRRPDTSGPPAASPSHGAPMAEPTRKIPAFNTWRRLFFNLFLLTSGACIFAIGLNGVMIPKQFMSGGVMGVALISHYLIPKSNVGLIYFVLNIPLILIGWCCVSRRFILYTAYGMTAFSVAAAFLFPRFPPIENPILAAVLGGIICGIGIGITLRSQGSGGGLDIPAVYLHKKLQLRMGFTSFLGNSLVLAVGAYFFGLEPALYSFIYVYTSGRVTDAVITGFNQRKSIMIISDASRAIAEQILSRLNRGVTFLNGTGAYTGEHKEVIFSIITLTELAKMKEMVFDIDPNAFMVVNDTLEVFGYRHGTRRIY
jgi:uncharacterized membrane-anchored protein YitT (DUF2179 family)